MRGIIVLSVCSTLASCTPAQFRIQAEFDRAWTRPALRLAEERFYSWEYSAAANREIRRSPIEIELDGPDAHVLGIEGVAVRLGETPAFRAVGDSGIFWETPEAYHYVFEWTCEWPSLSASFDVRHQIGAAPEALSRVGFVTRVRMSGRAYAVFDKFRPALSQVIYVGLARGETAPRPTGPRWLWDGVSSLALRTLERVVIQDSVATAMRRAIRSQFAEPADLYEDDVVLVPVK